MINVAVKRYRTDCSVFGIFTTADIVYHIIGNDFSKEVNWISQTGFSGKI